MRKLLISVLIVILLAISVYMCYSGITIINFKVLGFKQIQELNKELDDQIAVASKLVSSDYPTQLSNISKSVKELKKEKESYENLVTLSTDEQVKSSAKFEKYEIEYLWTQIGNHAKKEGVVMRIELKNSSTGSQGLYNLQFTVTGQYVGIADFIYDIENDSSLGFKIEDFKLEPNDGTENLNGTFTCKDISINIDSSKVVQSTNINSNANNTTTNNTNSNTTNTNSSTTNNNTTNSTGTTNTTTNTVR